MSHGRIFYQCGCLRAQCRCIDRGGHVTTWLDHPCPKHPSVVAPMDHGTRYAKQFYIDADRDRLLPEFTD